MIAPEVRNSERGVELWKHRAAERTDRMVVAIRYDGVSRNS